MRADAESRALSRMCFREPSAKPLLVSGILKDYRFVGAPPPRIAVVCCVVVGCVTVASRAVVVVLVVGSDEHEAKLSIAAIPSREINIFIGEFSLLRVRCKCAR